jgi:LytR cell envelope-related transcriptional attenuator
MTSSSRQRTGAHRPRRSAWPAAGALLLLVAVAAVVLGVRALGGDGLPSASSTSPGTSAAAASAVASPSPSPAASPTPAPTSAGDDPTTDPAADVDRSAPVTVLNATGRAGLATGVAATLRSAGWSVASTGNYRQDPPPTTVYYPGAELRATARAISEDLPGVQRVVRSARFGDAVVTVVLGADYSGWSPGRSPGWSPGWAAAR